jgi:CBS domain-containing protein
MRLADVLDICRAELVEVSAATSLGKAAQAMSMADATGVLVVGDDGLQGVVSRGDIIRLLATAPSSQQAWDGPVTGAITQGPEPINPELPVGVVITTMNEAGWEYMPVVTAQGIVMVSLSNLLLAENSFLYGEVQHLQTYIDVLHDAPND